MLIQWRIIGAIVGWLVFSTLPADAGDGSIPWECTGYEGAAQTRCLRAYIEVQRDKIAELEGQLRDQRGALGRLADQVDRQAEATADLQRSLDHRPPVVVPGAYGYAPFGSTYYGSASVIPPIGFGLYIGRPWLYGPSSFYRPYLWRPPYFGPRYRNWDRRW
ncbi:MAG: hypothetical protein AB7G48_15105 [Nitrospiraceae bacterium]